MRGATIVGRSNRPPGGNAGQSLWASRLGCKAGATAPGSGRIADFPGTTRLLPSPANGQLPVRRRRSLALHQEEGCAGGEENCAGFASSRDSQIYRLVLAETARCRPICPTRLSFSRTYPSLLRSD